MVARWLLIACLSVASVAQAQKAPFTVEALMQIQRISDPQLSPDGQRVAFVVQTIDLEKNARPRHIYVASLNGGTPRRLTWAGESNYRPRWSPDGRRIAFISDRSGTNQVWIMDADGQNPRQITDVPGGADGVLFSPDGQRLIFTTEVYPDCPNMACNQERLQREKDNPVKARIYERLLYRHWDHWRTARRRHLFVVNIDGTGLRDLTPGDLDVPPFSLGGPDDYAISPDGKEVCFVAKPDPNPATSTNTELFVVPIEGGEVVRLTQSLGADNSPAYSPDGTALAWRTQVRGGYESDRWRLAVMRRKPAEATRAATGPGVSTPGTPQPQTVAKITAPEGTIAEASSPPARWDPSTTIVLTEGLDRPVLEFIWAPDSQRIFFTVEDRGRRNIHLVSAVGGASRLVVTCSCSLGDMQISRDGKTLVYTQQSGSRPVEIYAASAAGGAPRPVTNLNQNILDRYHLSPYEEFRVEAPDRTPVYSFMIKPPNFDPSRRYPVLVLIHGGPQSAWTESWSYRWNAQVFAGAGYIVVMPNPRGSTGYGQRFTDEINADWGGKVYQDIMAVVDYVASLPYVDPDRMAAAGGSYGGYMVNWILGQTQRFKALVSHAGVFDLRSWAMETEELWFPIWDLRGMPWENPETYERWSPSNYIRNFSTPTLVIHGELDFRVPYGQALQLFTALQMRQVPSKLLIFPDEGHWVLKPQNSVLWYRTFLDWLNQWLRVPQG